MLSSVNDLHPLILPSLSVALGIIALVYGASRFVESAASLAARLGVSTLVIGLTIVSFGTSAPEVMVSLSASIDRAGAIAVGNAIGSNIANVGMVLGFTLLLARIPVERSTVKQELPVLLLVTALAGIFLYDAKLVFYESLILVLAVIPFLLFILKFKKEDQLAEADELIQDKDMSIVKLSVILVAGFVLLVGGAEALVYGAEKTALYFNVSPIVVGLTVVAIGTSLPELAASVASALKGHHDMAVGAIIGSNVFNLLLVLPLPGLFYTLQLEPSVFSRDYLSMAALTLALALVCLLTMFFQSSRKEKLIQLTWPFGLLLLAAYIGYGLVLFI